jgi:hypothetical protein
MSAPQTPARPTAEGADALWYARAVLADIAQQDHPTIIEACRVIEQDSDTPDERRDAANLRDVLDAPEVAA